MAFDNFGQIWRFVRLHAPLAPPLLVQFWVQDAYRALCNRRPWSWLRAESEFVIQPQKTGNVTVTQGSTTVLDAGIGILATDVGRQFRVGTSRPVYTVLTVNPGVSFTIDRTYGPVSQTGTPAVVLDAYLNCPADFQRFIAVLDQANNWQLHLWVTDEELNTWDAQRSASGTPWAVVSRRLSTASPTTGQVQYELWPYQVSAKNYPFFYVRRPETLVDATTFLGPLAHDAFVLVEGALQRAAEWPGPDADHRNPLFNLNLAQMKKAHFEEIVNRLEILDEEIYGTWLETVTWLNRMPFAPIDAKFLQGHDVPWGSAWGDGAGLPWIH